MTPESNPLAVNMRAAFKHATESEASGDAELGPLFLFIMEYCMSLEWRIDELEKLSTQK